MGAFSRSLRICPPKQIGAGGMQDPSPLPLPLHGNGGIDLSCSTRPIRSGAGSDSGSRGIPTCRNDVVPHIPGAKNEAHGAPDQQNPIFVLRPKRAASSHTHVKLGAAARWGIEDAHRSTLLWSPHPPLKLTRELNGMLYRIRHLRA